MSRPSDGMTFDELRDEFDWMFEFQSRMAERIRDDADVHNLVDYVTKLETENAELRKLAVLQSAVFKHMSTCPTTDCQVCPVNEECAESVHLEGLLGIDDKETSWLVQWRSEDAADVRAENAKLRELCKMLYQLADESYVPFGSVNRWMDDFAKAICAMRELGIEVES